MADFLVINGHPVPVGSCELVVSHIGESTLGSVANPIAIGAALAKTEKIGSYQSLKRVWRISTPPLGEAEAEGIGGLVRGDGHYWNFDKVAGAGLDISSRGVPKDSSTGDSQSTVTKKFGAGSLELSTIGEIVWLAGLTHRWTVMFWFSPCGGSFEHRADDSDGNNWVDGVPSSTPTDFDVDVGVSFGDLTLAVLTGGPHFVDDLIAVPYIAGGDIIASIAAEPVQFSSLPELIVRGDIRLAEELSTGKRLAIVPPQGYRETIIPFRGAGDILLGRIIELDLVEALEST